MATLSRSVTDKFLLKEKLGPFEALGGYILPDVTYRVKPLQFDAVSVAKGTQFTGYDAVNAAPNEAVVAGGAVDNVAYPRTGGNYNDAVGSSIEYTFRDGRFINVATLPDFGRGINISEVTSVQSEPAKYSSSEQANP